jgi:hypothetical protein
MGKLGQDIAPDCAILAPSIVKHSDSPRFHIVNIIPYSAGIYGINRAVEYCVCTPG